MNNAKGRVLVYSIVGCPHCLEAKHTLNEAGISYIDISLDEYLPEVREQLAKTTGKRTVPQIFFNDTFIGGNEDLKNVMKDSAHWNSLLDYLRDEEPSSNAPLPPLGHLRHAHSQDTDSTFEEVFTCELDEYARLVTELGTAGLVNSRREFTGRNFVEFIIRNKDVDEAAAIEMGHILIERHFVHKVKRSSGDDKLFCPDSTRYKLVGENSDALNAGMPSECVPRPAGELSEELRRRILAIYAKHLSPNGRVVDYAGIASSAEFSHYTRLARELQRVDVASTSREERLAFFINIYNALVIHGFVQKGAPTNLFQRWKFFNSVRYSIGGYQYNLQDIENGVLRANRKGVGMLFKPFGKRDPRLTIALDKPEPLIHFTLVCGAKSCPPIKTYSAGNIYEEMRVAAEAFLESDDGIKILAEKREVQLSKIFDWYREDFGINKLQVVEWIAHHMQAGTKLTTLQDLLTKFPNILKISHMHYDWTANSK